MRACVHVRTCTRHVYLVHTINLIDYSLMNHMKHANMKIDFVYEYLYVFGGKYHIIENHFFVCKCFIYMII